MKLFISVCISAFLCLSFLTKNESSAPIENPKPTLAKAITKILGAEIKAKNVWTFNTKQIHQWKGVPDFLVKGLGTKYKRFAYVRYNKKVKGVYHLVFTTPAELREEYKIDFVVAESEGGSPDGAGPKFKPCTMKFCDQSGNCITLDVLTDGQCIDMCSSAADCPEMEQCNKRMCQGQSCQNNVYWSSKCDNTPTCSSNEDCGGQNTKKTCYLKQCQSSECISVAVQIDQYATCPPNECSNDEQCETLGIGPPIIEVIAF